MADDANLQAAPAPDAGQPATQAVPAVQSTPPASDTPASAPAEPAVTATPQAQERMWAGKFKSPDVLEESYQHLQSESSRMAQELAELRKQTAKPAEAAPPSFSTEQLETYKEQWLVESATAAAAGDQAKAQQAARQIRLIDAELRKSEVNAYAQRQTTSQAYTSLAQEVQPILAQYKDDLQAGTPVYNQANALYQQALAAGAPANEITATSACLLALAKSGKFQQNTTLKASEQATSQLNQALKAAAVAGGGGSNAGRSATPDIAGMDVSTPQGKKAFEDYRASLGIRPR